MRFSMSRFKRGFVLSAALLFVAVFVAGCSLFAQNVYIDNNLIVAVIGNPNDPIATIRKRQLREAYAQWGFQFVQQGMEPEEAVNETIELLINREIMVHLSSRWYGTGNGRGLKGVLTYEEEQRALNQVFSSFDQSLRQIMGQVRNDMGIPDPDLGPEDPDLGTSHPTHQPFHPQIHHNRDTGAFTLDLSRFEVRPTTTTQAPTVAQYIDQLFRLEGVLQPRHSGETEMRVSRDTFARARRFIRNREQGAYQQWAGGYTDEQRDRRLITEELNRMLLEAEKDILVGRFRDMFDQGVMDAGASYFMLFNNRFCDNTRYFWKFEDGVRTATTEALATSVETAQEHWHRVISERNQGYIMDKVAQVEARFMREVRLARDAYDMGVMDAETIGQQILNEVGSVRWAPTEVVNQFFTVSHILIGFSDEQTARLGQLRTQLNQNAITLDEYNREVDMIRNAPMMRQRDTNGHEFGEVLTATEIMGIIENSVLVTERDANDNIIRQGGDIHAFQRMIYAFNTDPGMINAEFEYTMGIDTRPVVNGQRVGEDNMSRMVQEFTEASRALFDWHNGSARGQVGDWSHSRSGLGQNEDGLVWSQFGAHIIMYTRPVSEFVFSNSLTMLQTDMREYLFRTQTSYGTKTFFDSILEGINRGEFQAAERSVVNTFRQNLTDGITIFPSRFSDLWS